MKHTLERRKKRSFLDANVSEEAVSSQPDGRKRCQTESDVAAERNLEETAAQRHASRGDVKERMWDMQSSGRAEMLLISSAESIIPFSSIHSLSLSLVIQALSFVRFL